MVIKQLNFILKNYKIEHLYLGKTLEIKQVKDKRYKMVTLKINAIEAIERIKML